ncbi:hypothetical protein D3C81_843580 [compost metagenome]
MHKQLFAAINRETGVIIGLTDRSTESASIDSWPMDEECLIFLEALQAYIPKHTHTVEDIKWYYETSELRASMGWKVIPSEPIKLNEVIQTSKLQFETWVPC